MVNLHNVKFKRSKILLYAMLQKGKAKVVPELQLSTTPWRHIWGMEV